MMVVRTPRNVHLCKTEGKNDDKEASSIASSAPLPYCSSAGTFGSEKLAMRFVTIAYLFLTFQTSDGVFVESFATQYKGSTIRKAQESIPCVEALGHSWIIKGRDIFDGSTVCCQATENESDAGTLSSFESSSPSSKELVSFLTDAVNGAMESASMLRSKRKTSKETSIAYDRPPPTSDSELMEKIKEDYINNNYLWTGNLALEAFEENCKFQDPTISFEGLSTYQKNVDNLAKVVRWATRDKVPEATKSDLLDIKLHPNYIETRWNMVGQLTALPWTPTIDVIGRTKFWYRRQEAADGAKDGSRLVEDSSKTQLGPIQVFWYDESWEIPASEALWQLLTPTPVKFDVVEDDTSHK